MKISIMTRIEIAAQVLSVLASRYNSTQGKKQIVDNAIAYADMLLKRINEIPADAQQRSEAGQIK